MKAKVKIEKEIEIKAVLIEIAPRHIGDSDDDDMPTDFPLLDDTKSFWSAKVDVDSGIIEGWPKGEARQMHVKVCDAGIYTLFDASGRLVAVLNGYVPHGLVPGSFGDYVELCINEDGVITNWPQNPSVDEFFEDDE
jgi:hypothetical protein